MRALIEVIDSSTSELAIELQFKCTTWIYPSSHESGSCSWIFASHAKDPAVASVDSRARAIAIGGAQPYQENSRGGHGDAGTHRCPGTLSIPQRCNQLQSSWPRVRSPAS